MVYQELKQKHQEDINNFEGLFFAFNQEQYREGIVKVGASKDNKIINIGAGGYILKSQYQAFLDMFKRHKKELQDLKNQENLLIDAIAYELNNHEYGISWDVTDALDVLGLTKDTVDQNILKKAIKIYHEKL